MQFGLFVPQLVDGIALEASTSLDYRPSAHFPRDVDERTTNSSLLFADASVIQAVTRQRQCEPTHEGWRRS